MSTIVTPHYLIVRPVSRSVTVRPVDHRVITRPVERLVVVRPPVNLVLVAPQRGLTGPAGPAGLPAGLEGVAGETLSALRAVYVDPADGLVRYADKAAPLTVARLAGVTTTAAGIGTAVSVQTFGRLDDDNWSWDVDGPPGVFLGVDGALTQGPPATGAVARVGMILDATTIFVRVDPPVYRS